MKPSLYRSRTSRMIGGVCGGLGNYLGIDPTFVRIFFLLLGMSEGIGIVVYFLMWIIIPPEDARSTSISESARTGAGEIAEHARTVGEDIRQVVHTPNSQLWMYIGAGLILLGLFALLETMNLHWLQWFNWNLLWPVMLILGGVALLVRYFRKE